MKKSMSISRGLIALMLVMSILCASMLVGCRKSEEKAPDDVTTEAPRVTLDDDYREPNYPKTGIYVNYSANASVAGKVENAGTYRVDNGDPKKVKAVPYLGYRFVKWSDGSTDPVREDAGTDFSENTQLIAYFDYETLELPVICINTETGEDVQSKTEYIYGSISVFNSDSEHFIDDMEMQIRGRGNYSWTKLEKKSYKLKLSEKQSLLGLGEGKSKKWVLLANMCDQSMLRNYVSLNLAAGMPSISWSPSCKSVEVYLNGMYHGVYLLCEEIDANNNKVNVREDLTGAGEDVDFLIELSGKPKDPNFEAAERTYQIHSDLSSNADEAKKQRSFIVNYVQNAWNAVQNGSESEVSKYIDIDSMVDAYLVEEITKNLDCGYDSFYLYRNVGGKLTFGPLWDFDNSLGNANEGTERYQYLYAAYNERFQSNPWFYTIMKQEWFRERVLERWDEIEQLWAGLSDMVISEAKAGYNSYCRNFECWDLFGKKLNRETEQITSLKNYKEHYEFLAQWIDLRIEWLDEFFHSDAFIENWTGSAQDVTTTPTISAQTGNNAHKTLTTSHKAIEFDPFAAATDSPGFGNEGVENLFDMDVATKYCCPKEGGDIVITFSMSKATVISGYSIVTANDTQKFPDRNPQSWTLYGKNSAGEYVKIDSATADELGIGAKNYTGYGKILTNNKAYTEYKLVITPAGGAFQLSEICFFSK